MFEITYLAIPSIIIAILGATSNILLLVAFIKDPLKCFRNPATYLVANLAISDSAACIVISFLPFTAEKFGSQPTVGFLMTCFITASCVSIASISIDRFIIVAYPIKYRNSIKGKLMLFWVAGIWLTSCVFPTLIWIIRPNENIIKAKYSFNVAAILISMAMYTSTYYKLKKQSRNMALQNCSESRAREIRIMKEKRFLKTIIIIACVAFMCLVPSNVSFLIFSLRPKGKALLSMLRERALLYTFYLNFAVNPIIYALRLPSYRKTFYMLYCRRGS